MISRQHYILAVRDCLSLPLRGSDILLNERAESVIEICNGVGPESFPKELRAIIDLTHPYMITPSIIHDLRFYYGKGDVFDFLDSNMDFMKNSILKARIMYGKANPIRYIAERRSRQFHELLDRFGWYAYEAAIMERKYKNGQ